MKNFSGTVEVVYTHPNGKETVREHAQVDSQEGLALIETVRSMRDRYMDGLCPYSIRVVGAVFSPDRVHRYQLWRIWEEGPMVAFIGLNPSTADETQNDPTVRRCISYARDWGFAGMYMLNLFGLRSTDPKWLYSHSDPLGPDNVKEVVKVVCSDVVEKVVLAWGNHGLHNDQYNTMLGALCDVVPDKLYHFGLTKRNQPKHPLYLPKAIELRRFF